MRAYAHDSLAWLLARSQVRQPLADTSGTARAFRDGIAFADRWQVPHTHPAPGLLGTALTAVPSGTRGKTLFGSHRGNRIDLSFHVRVRRQTAL